VIFSRKTGKTENAMQEEEERESKTAKRLRSAVHLDNLPLELSDAMLQDLFSLCGPLSRALVKRPEGFAPRNKTGLLVYDFAESAELAVAHMAGLDIMGKSVTCDLIANPKDVTARARETQAHHLDDVSSFFSVVFCRFSSEHEMNSGRLPF
jgi:hypothetical protein